MSLVGHWRLDGDAKDSVGGYDGYEVGGPTYSSGKVGDCYDNTGNNAEGAELIRHDDFTEYEDYYSFSLWFKSTETASGYGNERIISRDASEYPTLTIDQTQSGNQGLNLYRTSMAEGSVSVNEWHHVVFTIDVGSNSSQLFIDGELRDTGDISPSTTARPFVIGGNTEGDGDVSGGNFIGKIDDVRLYDHILSAKEVQKLSQAKVLHYKFDSNLKEIESNFDSGNATNWNITNGYIKSDTSVSGDYSFGTDGQGGINATLSPNSLSGGRYIESFDFWWWETTSQSGHRVTLEDSSGNDVMYSETENPQWQLSNGSGGDDAIRGYDGQGYQIWTHFEFEFDWQNGTYDYRLSTIDDEYVSTGTQNLSNTTGVETIRLHSPTGSGNHNRFDSFTVTYRDGVTDASAYDNTGELNGPTFTESSKVGSGAYDFSDSNGVRVPNNSTVQLTGDLTVSFWAKPFAISSARQNPINKDYSDEFTMTAETDGDLSFYCNDSDSRYNNYQASNIFQNDNEWVHVTAVRDVGNEVVWYRNGEYWETKSWNGGDPIAGGDDLIIGDGYTNPYNGILDDVRLYATALSASEVKEIYEQRGSIDSAGNFHCHELLDTPSSEQTADENEWTLGTSGSQGSFSQNGGTSENDIIEYADPFGKLVPTWRCSPDSNSGADGGWNMNFQGDNSDRLRYSVFVKRTGTSMDGDYYHGCDNGGNTLNLDGTSNGNPYFHSGSLPTNNQWYLLVGILHPNSYSGGQGDVTGVYDMNGKKLSGGTDYKWGTGSRQEMRNYLYYSTDTSERQYFVYPRIDVVDGSEPDIASLVNGLDSRTNNQRDMNLTAEGTLEADLNEVGPAAGSLVGWWPLDGDTRDYSSYGRHGVEKNGVAITSGLGQSAYSFDGTDDYIRMPQDPYDGALDEQTAKMSLSGWIYPTGLQTNSTNHAIQNCWLGHSSGTYNDNMEMGVDASTNDIQVYFDTNGSDNTNTNTGVTAPLNTWTHVVVTLDLSGTPTMKLYKNGSLGLTDTSTWSGTNGTLDNAGAEFTIGASRSYREPYTGKIQDIRLHNRVLTPEEVEILYNLTDPRQNQQVVQTDKGLVHTKHEYDERL